MKTFILSLVFTAATFAEPAPQARITASALRKLQQSSPMLSLQQPVAVAVKRPAHETLLRHSTILHDGSHWTLVPNGALVYLPLLLRENVNAKPVGTLLAWPDFLMRNRSWITTNEVSFDQATGSEPIPAARVSFWSNQDKMVIAVHQGGPISVRLADASEPSRQP